MAEKEYYRIEIASKAPELKMQTIKQEQLSTEQQTELEESKAENKGKAAWLMPSGSIFWTAAGTEISSAKKIIFSQKKGKTKKSAKAKKKTKIKVRKKKKR